MNVGPDVMVFWLVHLVCWLGSIYLQSFLNQEGKTVVLSGEPLSHFFKVICSSSFFLSLCYTPPWESEVKSSSAVCLWFLNHYHVKWCHLILPTTTLTFLLFKWGNWVSISIRFNNSPTIMQSLSHEARQILSPNRITLGFLLSTFMLLTSLNVKVTYPVPYPSQHLQRTLFGDGTIDGTLVLTYASQELYQGTISPNIFITYFETWSL